MASNNIPADGTPTTGMPTDIGGVHVEYQPSNGFILASFLLPSSTTATTICAPSQQQQQVAAVEEKEVRNGGSPEAGNGGNDPSKDGNGKEDDCQRRHGCNSDSRGGENKENEPAASSESNGQVGYYEYPQQRGFSILRHLLENGKRPHTFQRLEPPCFEYFRRQQAPTSIARMFVSVDGNYGTIYYNENNQPITCTMNCGINCSYLENGGGYESGGWNYVPHSGEMRMEYFVHSQVGQGQQQQTEVRRNVICMGGRGNQGNGRIPLSDDELEVTSGSSVVGEDDDDEDRLVIDEGAGAGEQEVEIERYANQQMEPLNLSCR